MPISADPSRKVWAALEIDAPLPDETRPEFALRFMTVRQRGAVAAALEEIAKLPDAQAFPRLLSDVIGAGVVGWRNLPIEYAPEKIGELLDILSPMELWELARMVLYKPIAGESDLKKSLSRLASVADKSNMGPVVETGAPTPAK